MKMIDEELIKIKNAILDTVGDACERIILFGSYAYGTPRKDSDADILELNAEIRYMLYKKLSLPLDLVIAKKSVFERRSRQVTLENTIAKQGVRL